MASTEYTYSVSTDTLNGLVSIERLTVEIQDSAIVTALDFITAVGDVLSVWFKDPISTGDETVLTGIVNAHTGAALDPVGDVITTSVTSGDGTPVFATQQLIPGIGSLKRTDDGTELINVNGSSGGTAVTIWNGTGASDSGGDWTIGGSGIESSAADAGSGTNGWDSGLIGANNETTFDNGSEITVAGTYATLQFNLQPKAYPGNANLQLQWRNALGTVIGNTLQVENYTPNMDLDVWQTVSVPIADFALDADVQSLWVVYKTGTQQHWIDDMELLPVGGGGGGPYIFRLAPPDASKIYHLSMLVLQASAPEAGWNSSYFANISGGLANGLILRQFRLSTSETLWEFNTRNNMQLFGLYHPQESFIFADGVLLNGFMFKPGNAVVKITSNDVLELVVRDDLTSITEMRAVARFGIEEVSA